MENTNTKKRKFNIIDAIIILVVIAAIAFVGFKFISNKNSSANIDKYVITFYGEEVSDFVPEYIALGDNVYDDVEEVVIGTVVDIQTNDSVTYTTNDSGQVIQTSKPGYKSIKVMTEVSATEFSNGILVDDIKYGVGHTLTMRAGTAKLFLKVCGIEKLSESAYAEQE